MDLRIRGEFGVREGYLAKAGDEVVTHKHNFNHITYGLGSFRVEKLEEQPDSSLKVVRFIEKKRGGWVLILAGTLHRIVALEDGVEYHCIYLPRTPDGQVDVDGFSQWVDAYQ